MGVTHEETRPLSITCATRGCMIRMTLEDETTGEIRVLEVESTEMTSMLVQHLLMPDLTLEVLYGVRDVAAYRHTMFTAITRVARCCAL